MQRKILNFGSLNIDFVYEMEHFIRPGETASSLSLGQFAGGKGLNQSIALSNAGSCVWHAGAIGEDGRFLLELLQSKGVHTEHIAISSQRTGHAIIQVEKSGQNSIILYGGANHEISKEQIKETFSEFKNEDFLLLQNEINYNDLIIEAASEKGMTIILNPSPFNEKILSLPLEKIDVFLLNEIEGEELSGEKIPEKMIEILSERFPKSLIVLTLGKAGVLACYEGKRYKHGIYDVPVVDTTAAGDTFTGFFISAIMKKQDIPYALKLASKASSLAVGVKGASNSIPSLQDVISAKL